MLCASFLCLLGKSQINSFTLGCDPNMRVVYMVNNVSFSFEFTKPVSYTTPSPYAAGVAIPAIIPDQIVLTSLANQYGRVFIQSNIVSKSISGTSLNVVYNETYKTPDITNLSNTTLQTSIYSNLTTLFGAPFCVDQNTLFTQLQSEKNRIDTRTQQLMSQTDMTPIKPNFKIPDASDSAWFLHDMRNPIAIAEFFVRHPRSNGANKLSHAGNFASVHYIKPGATIIIMFDKNKYDLLPNHPLYRMTAYLKRKDNNVVPISIPPYSIVTTNSNETNFEKNKTEPQLNYNYSVHNIAAKPKQVEISTAGINPLEGDKLVVTIINDQENTQFTTEFEFQNFGWSNSPTGGFGWIRPKNGTQFLATGTAGYEFYYKHEKGANFWLNFFTPGFGPELNVLQDANGNATLGAGAFMSFFLKTVKVGYGWFLNGYRGSSYVSIGLNFVSGIQAIKEIGKRSSE